MKINKILAVIALFAFGILGCENDSDVPESVTTFFPKIEIQGEKNIVLPCTEQSYDDEGVKIFEGESEVQKDVTTTVIAKYFGNTDVNSTDGYEITYTALNDDGIPGSAIRNVFWNECNGDLVSSIAGTYISSPLRTDPFDDRFVDVGSKVIIKDLGNNQYQISDLIGGYYEFGRALGKDFPVTGSVVTANDISANNFDYGESVTYGSPFGLDDGQMIVTSLAVDPALKQIIMQTSWDLYGDGSGIFTWESKLTQVD